MTRIVTAVFAAIVAVSCAGGEYVPQTGDIIFQQSLSSDVENAIGGVTRSVEGFNFTHVGIVCRSDSGTVYVLEAVPPKVKATPLAEYLYPDGEDKPHPVSVAGRLKPQYRKLIPQAIAEAEKLVGSDYDYAFTPGDGNYYCSEYIYEAFKRANGGEDLFVLDAMTFKLPATGEIAPGWISYFAKLGLDVPEGEPGINPGAMSRSGVIDIIHYY